MLEVIKYLSHLCWYFSKHDELVKIWWLFCIIHYQPNELTRKIFPITGRASSFLVFLEFSNTK